MFSHGRSSFTWSGVTPSPVDDAGAQQQAPPSFAKQRLPAEQGRSPSVSADYACRARGDRRCPPARRPRRDTKGASTANQAAVTAMPSTARGLSIPPRLATSRIRASGFSVEQPLDSRQQ
jgi:hypothetical protein